MNCLDMELCADTLRKGSMPVKGEEYQAGLVDARIYFHAAEDICQLI